MAPTEEQHPDLIQQLVAAIESDQSDRAARLIAKHTGDGDWLNQAMFPWNMPPLAAARSRNMVDRLFEAGAQVQSVSDWWQPGFGAEQTQPGIAEYLVQRGAVLSPHAAAGIGLAQQLAEMIDADSAVVHAKGGDGCTPLHFARQIAVAELLLERGAIIDARDQDHDSTPAQWRIGDAPDLTRYLLDQGARPDIFMAAAFGDLELARQLVTDNPLCTA